MYQKCRVIVVTAFLPPIFGCSKNKIVFNRKRTTREGICSYGSIIFCSCGDLYIEWSPKLLELLLGNLVFT